MIKYILIVLRGSQAGPNFIENLVTGMEADTRGGAHDYKIGVDKPLDLI